MESLVLIDSCVFITLMKTGFDPCAELLEELDLEDIVTCGMVRFEVIRGIAFPRPRRALEGFFDVMQNVQTDNQLWESATELGWQLTRKGFNMPAQDILIAACALRVQAAVLTYDHHFSFIPGLRVFRSLNELR